MHPLPQGLAEANAAERLPAPHLLLCPVWYLFYGPITLKKLEKVVG